MPFLSSFLSFSTFHGKRCQLGASDFSAFHAAELPIGAKAGKALPKFDKGTKNLANRKIRSF